jgi:hypothetical protein
VRAALGRACAVAHAGQCARRPLQVCLQLFPGAFAGPAAATLEGNQVALADDLVVAELALRVAELFAPGRDGHTYARDCRIDDLGGLLVAVVDRFVGRLKTVECGCRSGRAGLRRAGQAECNGIHR